MRTLIFVLIAFATTMCAAQTDYRFDYTVHKLGDSIPIPGSSEASAHVLAFADPASCWTCDASLRALLSFSAEPGVAMTIFMVGQTQSFSDSLRHQLRFECDVLGDPIKAYARAYGVKQPPFFFITERSGRILGMDKMAGVYLHPDSVQSLIKLALNRKPAIPSGLAVRFSKVLHDSAGEILVGKRVFMCAVRAGLYAFLDPSIRTVYLADTNAFCQRRITLPSSVGLPYLLSRASKSETLLTHSIDPSTLNCKLWTIHLKTGAVSSRAYDAAVIPNGYEINFAEINPVTGLMHAAIRPVHGRAAFNDDLRSIYTFDSSGHLRLFDGPINPLFVHDSISLLQQTYFSFDDAGRVFEWQSPSNQVNYYNSDGKLIKALLLRFGPDWRPHHKNLPADLRTLTSDFWKDYDTTTSRGNQLVVDSDDKWLAAVYYNCQIDPNHAANSLDEVKTYHVHFESLLPESNQRRDVELPPNTVPFDVHPNSITAAKLDGNRLILYRYSL